ncbi:MAG: 3-hydroxyacyl-CoA dehydrogenase family protein [Flavisolibacter sp.]|jgi:3-hydroxybutyryl-CoA dehydrogenase
MQIIVHSDELLRNELLKQGLQDGHIVQWITNSSHFKEFESADAWIDLLFEPSGERLQNLSALNNGIVIISSVVDTLHELQRPFVRINGWRTFLSSAILEGSADPSLRERSQSILAAFNKEIKWLADKPGFITARVVSMIINEAFIALGENVSTREEIDIAMKLGTNYPYGPFEWAELIGVENIISLLNKLSEKDKHYQPVWKK